MENNNMPATLVSVILTSYNHGNFIRDSIQSILDQTYTNFELIIFDDCSTDNSWEVITSITDKRIKAIRSDINLSADGVIFDTIQNHAIGKYCAIAHSDDIWKSDKLQKQVDFLETNIDVAACFTLVSVIDEKGNIVDNDKTLFATIFDTTNKNRFEWLNHFFYKSNCLCHPSLLIRKEAYTECELDVRGLIGVPDFCQWIRLCSKKEIYILQERLTCFRVRNEGKNTSGDTFANRNILNVENFLILKEYLRLDPQDFIKVFPQADSYCANNEIIVEYVFGKILLEESNDHIKHLYGIYLLGNIFENRMIREKLERLYGYTIKELKQDKIKYDVFSLINPMRMMSSTLYFDIGNGFNKEDKITTNNVYINLNGNFEVIFDIEKLVGNKRVYSFYFEPDNKSIKKYKIEYVKVDNINQIFKPLNPELSEDGFDIFCNFNSAYIIENTREFCKSISISGKAVDYTTESIHVLNKKIESQNDTLNKIYNSHSFKILRRLSYFKTFFK